MSSGIASAAAAASSSSTSSYLASFVDSSKSSTVVFRVGSSASSRSSRASVSSASLRSFSSRSARSRSRRRSRSISSGDVRRVETCGRGDVGEVTSPSSPSPDSRASLAGDIILRPPDTIPSPNLREGRDTCAGTDRDSPMTFCSMRWNVSMLLSAFSTDDAISATLDATPGPPGMSIPARLSLNRFVPDPIPRSRSSPPAFIASSFSVSDASTSCSLSLTSSPSAHILGDGPLGREFSAAGADPVSRLSRTEGSAGSIGVSHAVARMTQLGDSSSDSSSDSDSRSGTRSDSDDSAGGRFDDSACVNSHSSGGGAGGVTDFGNPCSTLLGVDPFEGGCPVSGVNSSLRSRWNAARIHSGSAVVLPSPGENDVSLRSPSPGENDVSSSSF
mmetsp:Transcript_776/g.2766  ORF Transcript_776/g.2766 Transcript_776/m.2766 type:complete len:389 (+) Transcript_776:2454-3620(+)